MTGGSTASPAGSVTGTSHERDTSGSPRVVVLVGPPGAGKSTIGRRLSRELGIGFTDTDAAIERETGQTIAEIFATDGEAAFRAIEEQVVYRVVTGQSGVIALGGGAVLSAATRELLAAHDVVYVDISVAEGLRRTGASSARPLLNGPDPGAAYRELMRRRRPLYRAVATVRVRTDGRSPGRVVKMILNALSLESVRAAKPPAQAPVSGRRSRGRRRGARRGAPRRADPKTQDTQSTAESVQDKHADVGPAALDATAEPQAAATRRNRRTRARRARARAQRERRKNEQTTQTESEQNP